MWSRTKYKLIYFKFYRPQKVFKLLLEVCDVVKHVQWNDQFKNFETLQFWKRETFLLLKFGHKRGWISPSILISSQILARGLLPKKFGVLKCFQYSSKSIIFVAEVWKRKQEKYFIRLLAPQILIRIESQFVLVCHIMALASNHKIRDLLLIVNDVIAY
jgi:hypothetical protein